VHKRILILLILLIPLAVTAQKARPKNDSNYDERLLHFGFSMGLNTMDFIPKMNPSDTQLDSRGGFIKTGYKHSDSD
jgi:hypothetical protein